MLKAIYKDNTLKVVFEQDLKDTLINEEKDLEFFFSELRKFVSYEEEIISGLLKGFAVSLEDLKIFAQNNLGNKEYIFFINFFESVEENFKDDDGLVINFHQESFDTPERFWKFTVRQGAFLDYFFNRVYWYLAPKTHQVTDFPLHVDIESSNTCNMSCPMCYNDSIKHKGHMKLELAKKIIDECADNGVFSIRLSWRGETLSHPKIKEIISYATKKIKNVSFLTNAFYLNDEMSEFLVDAKVNYISVSFDGIRDVYDKVRAPAQFEDSYNRLKRLIEIRKKKNSHFPQLRTNTIWPAVRENPEEYYKVMSKVADYCTKNPYINFMGPMEIKEGFVCQYPWERVVVAYSGIAQPCTGWNAKDLALGDLNQKTIREVWHSNILNEIRTTHKEHGRMELTSCAECRHGSQGDANIDIVKILEDAEASVSF